MIRCLCLLLMLSFETSSRVNCTSVFGCPEDLFIDQIAPYVSTLDLQSLIQTTSSMPRILSHLLAQRHSTYIPLSSFSYHRNQIKQLRTESVVAAQEWFESNAIPMKHYVTKLEIAQRKCNDSNLIHDELRDGPSRQLLQHHISRYQLTHQDYSPVDVESIRWLIGQLSTLQFLSLEQRDSNPSRLSIVLFNDTIKSLETFRDAIVYGERTFGHRELKEIPMFIQMEWIRNSETPPGIMHYWLMVNRFLHDIHSIVPKAQSVALDQWLKVIRSFWHFLLDDVENHFFFRTFRRIQDIPRFQHSVRWTMFFYMFQTSEDPLEMVALKEMILSNDVFRNGIRGFIKTVEMALDDVKEVNFSTMNLSNDEALNDVRMDAEICLILDALNPEDWYQRWWTELFIDSYDRWRTTMVESLERDPEGYPKDDVLVATMLWDVETLVAFIEPKLYEREHPHRVLLSLRNRIRSYIFQLMLKES